jgi:hypothetical protein
MTYRCRRVLDAVTLLGVLGCVEPAADVAVYAFPPETSELEVVRNGGTDTALAEWHVDSAAVLTIGTVAGPGCTSFADLSSITELPSGHIVAASSGEGTLRVFDAEGRCVATLGRRGDGPGEFSTAIQVAAAAGDTVAVLEGAPRFELNLFSVSGGFIGSRIVSRDSLAMLGPAGDVAAPPELRGGGGLLVRTFHPPEATSDPAAWKRPREESSYIWLNRLPAPRRLGRWSTARDVTLAFKGSDGRNVEVITRALHVASTNVAVDPLGRRACIGDGYRPAFACFDAERGGVAVAWDAPLRLVSEQDIDNWVADFVESTAPRFGVDRLQLDTELRQLVLPSHQPFFLGLHVDLDLNVWVRPWPPLSSNSGVNVYIVFDRSGKLVARGTLPSAARPENISNEHILMIQRDSLGVPYIVRRKLLKDPR